MNKTITMDYDEFIAIKEKADLNQAAIDKRVNKQIKKLDKQLRESYDDLLKLNVRQEKREILQKAKKEIFKKIGKFGYVRFDDISIVLFNLR